MVILEAFCGVVRTLIVPYFFDWLDDKLLLRAKSCKSSAGFTLVELMITLAVAAMLGAIAAPSFTTMVQNARQVAVYNEFTQALRFSRSEATKRSIPVTMCARATDTTCGTDWNNGWLVFTDSSATAGSDLTLDITDTIIKIFTHSHPVSVAAAAVIRPASVSNKSMIQFSERGRSNWDSGTIVVCDDRDAAYARAMAVSGTGMIRTIRSAHGVAPKDASGTAAVTCPS